MVSRQRSWVQQIRLMKRYNALCIQGLVYMCTKGIELYMTSIYDELWQLARTIYKMALMIAAIPM